MLSEYLETLIMKQPEKTECDSRACYSSYNIQNIKLSLMQ